MIPLADFQPLSIAKINIFQQQPRFYSQICIVSKSMLVKRSRFVDTLRDAASFFRLSSFIEDLNYVHCSKLALSIAWSITVNKLRATKSSISPDE